MIGIISEGKIKGNGRGKTEMLCECMGRKEKIKMRKMTTMCGHSSSSMWCDSMPLVAVAANTQRKARSGPFLCI